MNTLKSTTEAFPQTDQAPRTLAQLIDEFETYDVNTALLSFMQDEAKKLNYRDLLHSVRQLACGLMHNGLQPADKVIICAPNSPEWIISFLAVIYAGAIATPVDAEHDDESLKHIFADSGAHWFFADERRAKRIRHLLPRKHLNIIRIDTLEDARSWKHFLAKPRKTQAKVDIKDMAVLFYTSGTTGLPKGVPLSHGNIMMQLDSFIAKLDLVKPGDRLLLPLPLFHVYPLNDALLGSFRLGLTVILPKSLTGPEIMRAINEGGATVLVGVPRLLRALYSGIEKKFHSHRLIGIAFDSILGVCRISDKVLSLPLGKLIFKPLHSSFAPTLRLLTSGGAPLDPLLAGNLRALGWDIAVGYGLTETAPLLCLRLPHNSDLESVGQAIPGVEIRIARIKEDSAAQGKCKEDAESKEQRKSGEGEIQARGANIFSGYLNLENKSDQSFTPDGWFKTGDLGYMHNGSLRITGRASSLIVMEGGKKIQPDDLEEHYGKTSGIREIGIFQNEHKLAALVVPDFKAIKDNKDVKKAISASLSSVSSGLPSYKRVADFAVTRQPLPRTNLGKIKRHELKERFDRARADEKRAPARHAGQVSIEDFSAEDRALLEDPVASQCWQWFVQRFPNEQVTPDTSIQLDLNVDSLEWMNLSLELLEQTGVEISEDSIARIDTVRDLLNEIIEAEQSGARKKKSPLEEPEEFLDDRQKRFLKPLNKLQLALAFALYCLNVTLMRALFRVSAGGLENLPAKQVVLVPNHASYLDAFAICAVLPFERLKTTQWAAWAGIAFANPFNSLISRLAMAFPIEAKRSLISSLALATAVLKEGRSLVWFPEGERTLTGKLLEFKPGIGILLEKHNLTVVPVYLDGTREALPPGSFWPHLKAVRVIFGQPIKSKELVQADAETPAETIADALRDRVSELAKMPKE